MKAPKVLAEMGAFDVLGSTALCVLTVSPVARQRVLFRRGTVCSAIYSIQTVAPFSLSRTGWLQAGAAAWWASSYG